MTQLYRIYSHAERQPDHGITKPDYPADPWDVYTEHDTAFVSYWPEVLARFPDFTWYICDEHDVMLAGATAVPLYFPHALNSLPDEGWRWAVKTAVTDHAAGVAPNIVSALGINVGKPHRGQGLSKLALGIMRDKVQQRGFHSLLAPVRPSQKHLYPLIPMRRYITWTQNEGLSWDAWIRTHQRLGAKIIKVAAESMVVSGTVAQWETWTTTAFPGSGQHIIPGALNPITIDHAQDIGRYVEENVWMVHTLDEEVAEK